MPEIAAPTEEVGALILSIAGSGIGAKRASGTVDNVLAWDAASGDITITPPVGTDVGGGTRLVRINGPAVATSSLTLLDTGAIGAAAFAWDAALGLIIQSYQSKPLRLNHYGNPVYVTNGPLVVSTDPGGTETTRLGGPARVGSHLVVQDGVTVRGFGNYAGGAADVAPSVGVVNTGALDIGDNSSFGVVGIFEAGTGYMATVALRGGFHQTAIINAIFGTWGTAVGAGFNINVYWDAGAAKYRVQNRTGATTTFYVFRYGLFSSQ